MKKTTMLVLCTLVLISCGSGVKIKKTQIRYFDSSFSAIVENRNFKQTGEGFKDSTLLNLLYIKSANPDSIHIYFRKNNDLTVSYIDSGQRNEKSFPGHFMKQGYYEFYFTNKRLEIPPLIPFLRLKHEINRVRLALTVEGDLVVDKMWDNSTSILLFFGAGDSRRQQSFFKINKL